MVDKNESNLEAMNVKLTEPIDSFVKASRGVIARNAFFLNNFEQKLTNRKLMQQIRAN